MEGWASETGALVGELNGTRVSHGREEIIDCNDPAW